MEVSEAVNILGKFCGQRDLDELSPEELTNKFAIDQADLAVLFGGSIMSGMDVFAKVIQNQLAKHYIIVGGHGHTTDTLREKVSEEYPRIKNIKDLSEAEIFAELLHVRHGLSVDCLETDSTNCGNNITNLLALLEKEKISFQSILLIQDATMQRRMGATLRKYVGETKTIIHFAAYQAKVISSQNQLVFQKEIQGMWEMERYLSLLMGEIPRLADTKEGYGPNGKNFIAHVDIPEEVMKAYGVLKKEYPHLTRKANSLFASKE